MKPIKYDDWKRHLSKRWTNKEYHVSSVSLKNIFNWKNATLKFNHPITLITGRNGTGKSTFINILKHIHNVQEGNTELGILSQIKDYEVKINNMQGKEIIIKNQSIIKSNFKLPSVKDLTFNSSLYASYKNSSGEDMTTYLQTLEQYDSQILPPEILSLMKEIIGKEIISSEKISDEENTNKEYYKLKLKDGTVYDSYTMGAGEFYINQFLWGIKELSGKGIVLIEELENFLHSEAQKKVLEFIHEYACKKNIQFVLTTHSPTLIEHSDINSKILIKNDSESNVTCINDCTNWLAKDVLGANIQNKVEILVEDEKSKDFVYNIISEINKDILKKVLITTVSGQDNIRKCIETNQLLQSSNIFGIADGDSNITENDNLIKIPCDDCPEKALFKFASENVQQISTQLNKDEELFKLAINNAKLISDPHEMFYKFAEELGEQEKYIWVALVKSWTLKNKDSEKFKNFEDKIKQKVNRID